MTNKYPRIEPDKRSILTGLFAAHRRRRISIWSVLEGIMGTAIANDESKPQIAQLTSGNTSAFGGDPSHPVARELIQEMQTKIAPESDVWRDLIIRVHGDHLEKHQRIDFSSEWLYVDALHELKNRLPDGFHIKRMDLDLARQIISDISPVFVNKFNSLEDFIEYGIGYCVTYGDHIVSGATSRSACKRGIDIQVYTHHDFLRRGLATAVSATLILHCLEHGFEPHWSASSAISAKLAEKLGYVQCDSYEELIPLPKR